MDQPRFMILVLITHGWSHSLTLHLLVSSADNFCKQFGPGSGPTKRWAWSGSKLYDTLIIFLKEFFEKLDSENNQQTTKKREIFPGGKELKMHVQLLSGVRYLIICQIVLRLPYFVCASSEGSGESVAMHRLVWAFTAPWCDNYHNFMCWVLYVSVYILKSSLVLYTAQKR